MNENVNLPYWIYVVSNWRSSELDTNILDTL